MSRVLAGRFDPDARERPAGVERLAAALAPDAGQRLDHGQLSVAYSGRPPREQRLLCLLDGQIDDVDELAAAVAVPAGDPERVLAAAYARWGERVLVRLRGDFALVIWDRARRRGLLVRDQLGVRGLHWHADGRALTFGSEVCHVLAALPRRPPPDHDAVACWVASAARPGDATLYAGVRRLAPGGLIRLAPDGWSLDRWWQPRYAAPLRERRDELDERVGVALRRAVARRLPADGVAAVMMSGGLDSSSVAAVGTQLRPDALRAYAATFPNHPGADESALIALLAERLRVPTTVLQVGAGGLLAGALDAIERWQLPPVGWGDFWGRALIDRARAEGAAAMLGGDGGDELFGVRHHLMADRLRHARPLAALRLARRLPDGGARPSTRTLVRYLRRAELRAALPPALHERLRARRGADLRESGWLRPRAAEAAAAFDPWAWKRRDGPRWWAWAAASLADGPDAIGLLDHLRLRARASGLPARHPLLDVDLVELALRLPPAASFDRAHDRVAIRRALVGVLPDEVRLPERKARFDDLVADCLTGPDGAFVRELLGDPRAEVAAWVAPATLRARLLDRPLAEHPLHPFVGAQELWRLATVEVWLRAQADPQLPGRMREQGTTSRAALAWA
ncbi:MAG TPA: asparagine synthase-related protein [Conexibacter sp.]|nr:asparagine synthase-related protein [Conexibacter sp.]